MVWLRGSQPRVTTLEWPQAKAGKAQPWGADTSSGVQEPTRDHLKALRQRKGAPTPARLYHVPAGK